MLKERLFDPKPIPDFFVGEKCYAAGQIIYREGEYFGAIHAVRSGLIAIEQDNPYTEKTATLAIVRPGELFGVEDFFEGEMYQTQARAITPSTIAEHTISGRTLESEESRAFATAMRERLLTAEEKQFFKGHGWARGRTAYTLAELSFGNAVCLSHPEIGKVAGLTREAVGKNMRRLSEKGIIYQAGIGSIEIINRKALLKETKIYPT